jgi:hypothetical protein
MTKLALDKVWRQFVVMFLLSTGISDCQTAIEHDQSPTRSKRSECVIERQFGIREFMVGVRDEHRVHNSSRQVRIVRVSDMDAYIVLTPGKCPDPQKEQRQFANIHSENFARPADRARQFQREVARTRAHISNHIALI